MLVRGRLPLPFASFLQCYFLRTYISITFLGSELVLAYGYYMAYLFVRTGEDLEDEQLWLSCSLFWISSHPDTLTYTWDIYAVYIYLLDNQSYTYTRIYVELSMIMLWHIAAGTFEVFGITNVCNSGHHVEALVEIHAKYRSSNTPAEGRWWRKLFACSEARGPTNQLVSNLNQDPSRWLNRIYSYSWLLFSLLDTKRTDMCYYCLFLCLSLSI